MSKATNGLHSLAVMAQHLAATRDLNGLLEAAAERACVALAAASVSISQTVPTGDAVRTIINVGELADVEERWPEDEVYSVDVYSRLATTMKDRTSWVECVDDPEAPEEERQLLLSLGKGCSLTTAIVVDGHTWGEFYVTRHLDDPVFDQEAVQYAELLVAILAAAVSSSIRQSTLHELASRDPLTGLLNRRALDERAATMFELGDEPSREVAVVAIDINGLKLVNDTEGHPEGDEVIRTVAAALAQTCEAMPSSVVARIGGDEFTVVVSGSDVAKVEEIVNLVCHEVGESNSRIGLSAGFACVQLTSDTTFTMSDVFAAADRAQYVAKRTESRFAVRAEPLSG
jgi:diguanylate cyclase (GGDEF)-like protein